MNKYQKRNKARFAGALVCIFISNAFAVILQFFKGDNLDNAISGETGATLQSIILLITFILGEILFYFGYRQFSARFVVGCTGMLKHDIFESIISRDFISFKKRPEGEYLAKYTNEADAIRTRRFEMLPLLWDILSKILFVAAALFRLDFGLAVITIVLLTTPLYLPKLIEKQLQKAQNDYLISVEDNLTKVTDWLRGFEIIKNYSIESKILAKFNTANMLSMEKLLKDMSLGAVSQLITTLISYLSYFIVLVYAAWLVLRGEFTAGSFFVAIGMIDQLSYPLISLAEIIRQLVAIRPACLKMEEFIAEGASAESGKTLDTVRNVIRYHKVSFAYPGGKPILSDFSFDARKGGSYLIKGPSGCGKTTAVNMLLRYYDADKGSIEIDGIPITEYSSTYGCITVVRQDAVLFHDTLRNNLTMYRDIPDDRLISVLDSLGLSKFANKAGLDSMITENGSNLSGGEKKRICLARALLRNTDVLILDEPLANLDDVTADKIEDLLLEIEEKLLIVVSHQFTEDKVHYFDSVLTMG